MRLALLSDIHGNSVALRACLDKIDAMRPDHIYFLGDAVGYLPDASGCLSLLEKAGALCQQGNHESMLLSRTLSSEQDAVYGLAATRRTLGPELIHRLAAWPTSRTLELAQRRVLLVHGSPEDLLNGYVYPDQEPEHFMLPGFDFVAMGHTHHPFALRMGERLLLNVGSVGLPRDVGNLASFGFYDSERGAADIYRVEFDVVEVLARWGNQIHTETASCLARTADHFEGKQIA